MLLKVQIGHNAIEIEYETEEDCIKSLELITQAIGLFGPWEAMSRLSKVLQCQTHTGSDVESQSPS